MTTHVQTRLTLTPDRKLQVAPIGLFQGMLPIGCNDEPFASYPAALSSSIARRHARIYFEDGHFFACDLGSPNGTQLNGTALGTSPERLRAGDKISFSNALTYTIAFDDVSVPPTTAPGEPDVILDPTDITQGHECLVIRKLPFLVGKQNEQLAAIAHSRPEEFSFLSRQHALIYSRDGQLYLEDLGSTNGTFVGDQRLCDHAVVLNPRDVVSFGGQLSYRVRERVCSTDETRLIPSLRRPESTSRSAPIPRSTDPDPHKTRYVESPSRFVEILCGDLGTLGNQAPSSGRDASASARSPADSGLGHRTRRWLKGAMSNKRAQYLTAALIATLALSIGVSTWLLRSPQGEAQFRKMVNAGQTQEALDMVAAWRNSDSLREVGDSLVTEAIVRHSVPAWLAATHDGDFAGAKSVVDRVAGYAGSHDESVRILKILAWANDLHQHIAEHGETSLRLHIYRDEPQVRRILDEWDADSAGNKQLLSRISRLDEKFGRVERTIYRHLRALRELASLHLPVIATLSGTLEEDLKRAAMASSEVGEATLRQIADRISDLRDRFPRIHGTELLDADLNSYKQLSALRGRNDLDELLIAVDAFLPATPVFQAHMYWYTDAVLPSPAFIHAYKQATTAWRRGQSQLALRHLQQLDGQRWGQIKREKTAHYANVSTRAAELATASASPSAVVAFYEALDANEDIYFRDLLSARYEEAIKRLKQFAEAAWNDANKHWVAYNEAGGIAPALRVERRISTTFKKRASSLSKAHRGATEAAKWQRQSGIAQSAAHRQLQTAIHREVGNQRRWLTAAELALRPSLIKKKLSLLPSLASTN
ncbi:MAG: FHA domain-containing protein [Gammaproteobacteria bacterium]|nr:FHA domain-containing protein [Gammaproteobacteria bacterium]